MADLNVTAEFRSVERLQEILGELAPLYGRVVARLERENKQLERATKASMDSISRAFEETFGTTAQRDLASWGAAQRRRLALMQESEKIAERQAVAEKKVTQELLRQREAQEELARANAQRVQSQIGVNLGLGGNGISAGASASAFEGEIERLRTKYDEIYRSAVIYENALNELNQAHLMGVLSTAQHAKQVDMLNAEYQAFQNGAVIGNNRFAQASQQAAGYTNQLGVVVQQAGYQVGDFLVQVQSGTNWLVAFGQQATQLVGVLPLMPGLFGLSTTALVGLSAGLGIAIPLVTALGAAWLRSTEDVSSGGDIIEETLKKLQQETKTLQEQWSELKFGDFSGSQVEDLKNQAAALRAEIESLTQSAMTSNVRLLVNLYGPAIASAERELALVVEKLNALEAERNKRSELQRQLDQAESIHEAMLAIELGHARAAGDKVRRAREYQEALKQGLITAERIKSTIESIANSSITVSVKFQARFEGFTGAAAEWVGSTYEKMRAMAEPGYMASSPNPRSAPPGEGGIDWGAPASSGGGGGGGGSDPFQSEWEQLQNFLKSEAELEIEAFEGRQATLEEALNRKLITLSEYQAMEQEMLKEHSQTLADLDVWRYGTGLQQAEQFFGDMANAMQGGNDKMQRIAKTFAAVESTINAYRAFNQVLADPSLPWYAKIPKAAAVLAAGMGVVQSLKGSSGGGGGSVGTSTVSQSASAPSPQTVYIDSINPDALYSGQSLINLFDAFYNENDKRGKVFVVAR